MGSAESMGIAELAERADVTPRTIRYYISIGLLPPAGGRGRRQTYGHEHYVRLLLVQRLKDEYLPLEEIRRRLDRLSLRDMERLLSTAPPPKRRRDTREFVESLWREGRSRVGAASEYGTMVRSSRLPGPAAFAGRFHESEDSEESPTTLREQTASFVEPPEPTPPTPSSTESWRRVPLDQGVELHYQTSGDERRDRAIQHIIQFATRALRHASELEDPGEPRPHGDEKASSEGIHVIQRGLRFTRLADNEYESGYWDLSPQRARELVGRSVYFHKGRREPSYFGGTILGFRVSDSAKHPDRIVFRLRSGPEFEGVQAGELAWRPENENLI